MLTYEEKKAIWEAKAKHRRSITCRLPKRSKLTVTARRNGIDIHEHTYDSFIDALRDLYTTKTFEELDYYSYGARTHCNCLEFLGLPKYKVKSKFTKKEQEAVDYLKSRGYKVVAWGRKAKPKTKA
jgi:hypothetical protein